MTADQIDKLKALALAATEGGEYFEMQSKLIDFQFEASPWAVLELIAEVEKLQARFEYIEEHATTHGGGHGFTVSFFVPVDCEDIGCGIDAAIAAHTKAGKEPA
jgi:hypothetical protein